LIVAFTFVIRLERLLAGSELQTVLTLKAWVGNVAYVKFVGVDAHVFDAADALVRAARGPSGRGDTLNSFMRVKPLLAGCSFNSLLLQTRDH
jgi:hypothetical protein